MTTVKIELGVPDELADPDHDTGLTQDGYDELNEALHMLSWDVISGPDLVDP